MNADVDECAEGTHNCDTNANCTNIPGSFLCICKDGFTGDGISCEGKHDCVRAHFQGKCTIVFIGGFWWKPLILAKYYPDLYLHISALSWRKTIHTDYCALHNLAHKHLLVIRL